MFSKVLLVKVLVKPETWKDLFGLSVKLYMGKFVCNSTSSHFSRVILKTVHQDTV